MDTKETLSAYGAVQGLEYHLFETNQMEQEKMEKIESPESSETANYNENIFMLTALTDTSAVNSLPTWKCKQTTSEFNNIMRSNIKIKKWSSVKTSADE